MQKSELIDWLQEKQQKWEAFLDAIGPTRLEQPGVNGEWSLKDIVAHLTSWNWRLVAGLQAAERGQPEPPPHRPAALQTEDEINAWIYQANRGRSVGDIREECQRMFRELFAALAALPEDVRFERVEPKFNLVWLGDTRFAVGEFFDHFEDDHEPDVRAWLARDLHP